MHKEKDSELSRKQFLKSSFWEIANLAGDLFSDTLEKIDETFPDLIRPPGALPEEQFLKTCNRCGTCMKMCPHFVIRKYHGAAPFVEETPSLILKNSFCRMCKDFPCISSCPTGALKLPEINASVIIGIAKTRRKLCLRAKGIPCNSCIKACSEKFNALADDGLENPPRVDPGKCTGCGACESVCPVDPDRAIFVVSLG